MMLPLVTAAEQAPAAGTDFPLSAAIAAVVSVFIFWLGQVLTRNAARKERQRQVIEDWFRTLSKWVDAFGSPSTEPDYNYHELTNRQVLELSLTRKNRYLAWWMHEMAVAVITRRMQVAKNPASGPGTRAALDAMLTDTGEHLLAWHHGELKSTDFHIPYQLHIQARNAETDVRGYAEKLRLSPFVEPVRMNFRRSWQLQRLLLRPDTGTPILKEINHFISARYAVVGLLVAVPERLLNELRIRVLQQKLARLQRQSNRRG
ncbi:hypothetical protein LFT45_04330 [Arthrobacter sp. FW305-BF8]|uniref:hypothetical protein n=1 Tax=Arthrobacter sp. FW305-BF8 TaxID=2879617 RepID=UPI001F34E439|nr:hypothetical protein [Arthrobacter sp. FW305-BF8]UKA55169.1 hypothetical protein LFT45_04330 [Arthrobacter sp. FW305-BF8]